MKIAIVGSGPSAAAALNSALSVEGLEIFHIDSSLESGQGIPLNSSEREVLTKSFLGGDYPYRRFPGASELIQSETTIPRSFANGGLSLVWGATMLPYAMRDCNPWPIQWKELETHYEVVAGILPCAGYRSFQNPEYKDYGVVHELNPTDRFVKILSRKRIRHSSVVAARVSIQTKSNESDGCVLCDGCLSGCQWDYIWNSASYIRTLKADRVMHMKLYLDSFSRSDGKVTLHLHDYFGKKTILKDFDKVFLACGVVETFRILAKSQFVKPSVSLSDSSIAYVPFLSPLPGKKKSSASYSLTQLAFRLPHNLEGRPAHLQLYEVSKDVEKQIFERFPILEILPLWISKFILSWFVIGIFYLPSELSTSVILQVNSDGSLASSLDECKVSKRQQLSFIKRILRQNLVSFLNLGLVPLSLLLEQKPAGSGVHTGSSIPMGIKTDTLGRLDNLNEVHIVDASVLPDIPAGPITYSVMANASRIVAETFK